MSNQLLAVQTEDNLEHIAQCEKPKGGFGPDKDKPNPLTWTDLEPRKLIRRNGSRVEVARAGTHAGRVVRVRREGTKFTADVAFAGDAATGLAPWEQTVPLSRVRARAAVGDKVRARHGVAKWAMAWSDAETSRETGACVVRLPLAAGASNGQGSPGDWPGPGYEAPFALVDLFKMPFKGPSQEDLTRGSGWPWSVLHAKLQRWPPRPTPVRRFVALPPNSTRADLLFDNEASSTAEIKDAVLISHEGARSH